MVWVHARASSYKTVWVKWKGGQQPELARGGAGGVQPFPRAGSTWISPSQKGEGKKNTEPRRNETRCIFGEGGR
jgi:hypothetical protein